MENSRSPLTITLSVWKALILREAVHRLFNRRAAWVWLMFEPVAHFAAMTYLFVAVRVRVVGGIDTAVWLLSGVLVYFMFKRTAAQARNAIDANEALFAYRQVKPVDTVLARAALEGFLTLLLSAVVFGAAAVFGLVVLPADPLAVLAAVAGMWLLGLGWGLVTSVVSSLVAELGKVIDLAETPLYFASGVIFPIAALDAPYRGFLMLNPMANGIEAARLGFAPYYHAAAELSLAWLYGCALIMVFFGLALHVRFAARLASR